MLKEPSFNALHNSESLHFNAPSRMYSVNGIHVLVCVHKLKLSMYTARGRLHMVDYTLRSLFAPLRYKCTECFLLVHPDHWRVWNACPANWRHQFDAIDRIAMHRIEPPRDPVGINSPVLSSRLLTSRLRYGHLIQNFWTQKIRWFFGWDC